MIPILFEKSVTTFNNNGLGALADAISCIVTEERNGPYELTMEYPIDGIHYDLITYDCIIKAKPNETSSPQAFRIYDISRPFNGIVTIAAEHISYQARHIPVAPFAATSAVEAFAKLSSFSAVTNPFTFWTDKTTVAGFSFEIPTACRSLLGGIEGSILDVYGGEYEWDNYTIKLHNNRGANNGVKIAYGKNLIDLKQEENISNVITGIMPYWYKDGVLVQLTEKVLENTHTYSYSRVIPVDFTQSFQEQPTEDQLRTAGLAYISQNGIGLPKVSIKADYINLGDTEEYPELKNLERVSLCDTVAVEFTKLGVTATSKVIKTVYNALLEKNNQVELGEASSNLAKTLAIQSRKVEAATPLNYFEQALLRATEAITGNSGGSIVFRPKYNPQEILFLDTTDINTAVNVVRINNQGFAASNNGVNGPFGSTWTIDNILNMANINVINMSANLIRAGILAAKDNSSWFNLDTGTFSFAGGAITYDGKSIQIKNSKGDTFGDNGIVVDRDGSATKSMLDETGLEVLDKTGATNSRLLFAGYEDGKAKVETEFIEVKKYIKIGNNSRIEDYGTDRTGIFFVG